MRAKFDPLEITEVMIGRTVVDPDDPWILVMFCIDPELAPDKLVDVIEVTRELDEVDFGIGSLAFWFTILLSKLVDVAERIVNDIGLNFLVLFSPRFARFMLVRFPIGFPLIMLPREDETSLNNLLLDALNLASLLLIISLISSKLLKGHI